MAIVTPICKTREQAFVWEPFLALASGLYKCSMSSASTRHDILIPCSKTDSQRAAVDNPMDLMPAFYNPIIYFFVCGMRQSPHCQLWNCQFEDQPRGFHSLHWSSALQTSAGEQVERLLPWISWQTHASLHLNDPVNPMHHLGPWAWKQSGPTKGVPNVTISSKIIKNCQHVLNHTKGIYISKNVIDIRRKGI